MKKHKFTLKVEFTEGEILSDVVVSYKLAEATNKILGAVWIQRCLSKGMLAEAKKIERRLKRKKR